MAQHPALSDEVVKVSKDEEEEAKREVEKYIIKWGDLLEVGIGELDDQHHKCVDHMNLVYNKPSMDSMKRLKTIFVAHLDTEQRLFEKYNYKEEDRRAHNIAHGVMVKLVNEEMQRIKESEDQVADKEWVKAFATSFKEHAFEYDSMYMDYIAAAIKEQEEQKEEAEQKKVMGAYMRNNGFYSQALQNKLQARGVTKPEELATLSEFELHDILEDVKKVGFIGRGVAAFEAAWKEQCTSNPRTNARDSLTTEIDNAILAAREQSKQFAKVGRRGLLGFR